MTQGHQLEEFKGKSLTKRKFPECKVWGWQGGEIKAEQYQQPPIAAPTIGAVLGKEAFC